MNGENPNEYVAALKRSGAGDEAVTTILRNAGWPEKEAVAALASYYETVTGIAVPSRRRSAGGPKDAFLHLLSFLTLATWCIAAGSLWFTLIDSWFPDPAAAPVFSDPLAAMAWNLASVLVGFPVFLLVMRIVWRELQSQPVQVDSALRRWLTYLALLVAAGVVIGDSVVFVARLLQGEITVRFVLKVVTVLVLAGGVFWFFLRSVQSAAEDRGARLRRLGRTGAAAAGAVVILTLVVSFAKFGAPSVQRLSALDERRSENLEAIAAVIRTRWTAAQREGTPTLPESLRELPESPALRLTDPTTGLRYGYSRLGSARYQLCAKFETDTMQRPVRPRPSLFRIHPAGDYCFELDPLTSVP